MLGKIIEGKLSYPPKNLKLDDGKLILNFNKNEELMRQYGYKDIIDVKPAYDETSQYLLITGYTDRDSITINYDVVDCEPEEPVVAIQEINTRVTALEKQVAEQSTILSEEVNRIE